MAYWNARRPSDCQHYNGPFDKSYRHFSGGQPVKYCSQKHFVGTEVIVFAINRIISHILLQEKGSVTGEFYHHEKNTTHRDSMLTYLPRRHGLDLGAIVGKTNSVRV